SDDTTGQKAVDTGTFTVAEAGGLTNYTSALACFNDNGAGGGTTNDGIQNGGEAAVSSTNGSVAVAAGDHVICTFTNTRNQGTIELKKHWVGTAGTTPLSIDQGQTPYASLYRSSDGTTGQKPVDTGTFTVSETGGLTNYTSALACFNDTN